MPPVPSGDWISYGPSLVPEVSPIYARNYSSDRGSSTQSNEVQSSRRSTGDCRCQFWCQLVLRFGALSCALVLFLATQSVDSVTSCSSVRFDARTSVGLRVSCFQHCRFGGPPRAVPAISLAYSPRGAPSHTLRNATTSELQSTFCMVRFSVQIPQQSVGSGGAKRRIADSDLGLECTRIIEYGPNRSKLR